MNYKVQQLDEQAGVWQTATTFHVNPTRIRHSFLCFHWETLDWTQGLEEARVQAKALADLLHKDKRRIVYELNGFACVVWTSRDGWILTYED